VLDPEELQRLISRARRRPLMPAGGGFPVTVGTDALQRLLPHRPPMLLVDSIDALDSDTGTVRGTRVLRPGDLGFDGHFPGDPIYPGVLVVEAMGQLGITLLHFAVDGHLDVAPGVTPKRVRATHIHHATFIAAFEPGDTMTLYAQVAHADYTLIALGQAWKGDTLAAFGICEVFVDE
jgi:3-hydroxymyristoyl/3-hydroxydecanoyl-(acyl carrier protein) dehydratase